MDDPASLSNRTAPVDMLLYSWEEDAFTTNHHVIISENYLLFTLTLLAALLVQHLLHRAPHPLIPPSAATILLSIGVGFTVRALFALTLSAGKKTPIFLNFSTQVFYFVLLPPIIFTSGYHLQRSIFIHNLDAILSLAFVGTFLSTLCIAVGVYTATHRLLIFTQAGLSLNVAESVALGALLSSTDPVATLAVYQSLGIEKQLYYLVFGESVLNDAVAITAFKLANNLVLATAQSETERETEKDPLLPLYLSLNFLLLFVGSSVVGYASALSLALLFKNVSFANNKILPLAVLLCASFVPFFLAETLQLSGIVAIFFAGIATRRYVVKNVRESVKVVSSTVFETLSYLAETACFVFMGLAMVLTDYRLQDRAVWAFIALSFALCLVARVVDVYALLSVVNVVRVVSNRRRADSSSTSLTGDNEKPLIPHKSIAMVSLAGIRGAVAYALAYDFHDTHGNRQLVISATSVTILLSILLLGGITSPLIAFFGIPTDGDHEYTQSDSKPVDRRDFEYTYLYPIFLRPPSTTNALHARASEAMRDVVQLLSPRSSRNNTDEELCEGQRSALTDGRAVDESSPLFINTPSDSNQHYEPSSGGGSIHDIPEEIYTFTPRRGDIWSPLRSRHNLAPETERK